MKIAKYNISTLTAANLILGFVILGIVMIVGTLFFTVSNAEKPSATLQTATKISDTLPAISNIAGASRSCTKLALGYVQCIQGGVDYSYIADPAHRSEGASDLTFNTFVYYGAGSPNAGAQVPGAQIQISSANKYGNCDVNGTHYYGAADCLVQDNSGQTCTISSDRNGGTSGTGSSIGGLNCMNEPFTASLASAVPAGYYNQGCAIQKPDGSLVSSLGGICSNSSGQGTYKAICYIAPIGTTTTVVPTNTPRTTTPPGTTTVTTPPTSTTPPAGGSAQCTSLNITSRSGNTVCYQAVGDFAGAARADSVRIFYDKTKRNVNDSNQVAVQSLNNSGGHLTSQIFCHTYDNVDNITASTAFYTSSATTVDVTGNEAGQCLKSFVVTQTTTPPITTTITTTPPVSTTIPPKITTTPPGKILAVTGQDFIMVNLVVGMVVFFAIVS